MTEADARVHGNVPYPGRPYSQSHPDRLATCARLRGIETADVSRCRVLELGCGDGENLIPMAVALPGSVFVGVDLSERAVATARSTVSEIGLSNVDFSVGDVRELDPSLGTFDYVIAHGLYSWVPEDARDALLEACRRHLSPNGVAYVSYATYPGAHFRAIAREMMRRTHRPPSTDLLEAVTGALDVVRSVHRVQHPERAAYAKVLELELRRLGETDPEVVLHDDLAEVNVPIHVEDFVAHARSHELSYLGEALFSFFEDPMLTPDARKEAKRLSAVDPILAEQYLDFVRNGVFRQSLLCHRSATPDAAFEPRRVLGLVATSHLRATVKTPDLVSRAPVAFAAKDGGSLTIVEPVAKAALAAVAAGAPEFVNVSALWEAVCASVRPADGAAEAAALSLLATTLLELSAVHLLELRTRSPGAVWVAGERPRAHLLAIFQAKHHKKVTTLKHGQLRLADEASRCLLTMLDGTRSRSELVDALRTEMQGRPSGWGEGAKRADSVAALDDLLRRFGELGVLVA